MLLWNGSFSFLRSSFRCIYYTTTSCTKQLWFFIKVTGYFLCIFTFPSIFLFSFYLLYLWTVSFYMDQSIKSMVFNSIFYVYLPVSICVQIFIPLLAKLFHYSIAPCLYSFFPNSQFLSLCIFTTGTFCWFILWLIYILNHFIL